MLKLPVRVFHLLIVLALAGCATLPPPPAATLAVRHTPPVEATAAPVEAPGMPPPTAPQPTAPEPGDPPAAPGAITPENAGQLRLHHSLGKGERVGGPRFSPDGRWLAVGTRTGVYLYDTQGYPEPRLLGDGAAGGADRGAPVYPPAIAFTPDSRRLVMGSQVISLEDGQPALTLETPDGTPSIHTPGAMQFTPDGQYLAISYYDPQTSGEYTGVWHMADGKLLRTLPGGAPGGDSAAGEGIAPDGRYLLTRLFLGEQNAFHIYLYDLQTGEQRYDWPGQRAALLPGEQALVEDQQTVRLYDLQDGRVLRSFNGQDFAAAPDGQELAVLAFGRVRRYRLAGGNLLAEMEGPAPNANAATLRYAPGGGMLLGLTRDEECCGQIADSRFSAWQLDGRRLFALEQDYGLPFSGFDIAPDGRSLAVHRDEDVQVRSLPGGQVLARLQGYTAPIIRLAFLPDGQQLVAATYGSAAHPLLLYQVDSGALLRQIPTTINGPDYGMAVHPDGQTLALSNSFYRLADGQPLNELSAKMVAQFSFAALDVAFSPDGRWVATGGIEGNLQIWDYAQQTQLRSQAVCDPSEAVTSLSFSPDSRRLALVCQRPFGGGGSQVLVYPVSADGERLLALPNAPTVQFSQVSYAPNGRYLAASGQSVSDRNICPEDSTQAQVWDAESGAALPGLQTGCVRAQAFSPDSRLLALALLRGGVELWSIPQGVRVFATSGSFDDPASAVAFSPDGTRLAVGYEDGSVQIWEVGEP